MWQLCIYLLVSKNIRYFNHTHVNVVTDPAKFIKAKQSYYPAHWNKQINHYQLQFNKIF